MSAWINDGGLGYTSKKKTDEDLRDYFAAKAMQAVICGAITHTKGVRNEEEQRAIVRFAYEMADMMIAERDK